MPMMPNKKLRPMVGQGTQGQMIGNKQTMPNLTPSPNPNQPAASIIRSAQAQMNRGGTIGNNHPTNEPMVLPMMGDPSQTPGSIAQRNANATQIQDGLKNQLGGKSMGGGTHTMPDGTMMPNKAMPMPRPMPGQKPMGLTNHRPMPRPMKPKPMKPGTVGPIGL